MSKCFITTISLALLILSISKTESSKTAKSFSERGSPVLQKIEEDTSLQYDVRYTKDEPISLEELHKLLNPTNTEEASKRIYTVTNSEKERYHCFIPLVEPKTEDEAFDDDDQITFEDIQNHMIEVISVMGESCIVREEGWWSYEFCPGPGTLNQYHENRRTSEIEANIVMGTVPTEREWRVEQDSVSEITYIKENFYEGDRCDLPPQLPRTSEVWWYCNHRKASGTIFSISPIEEPSSCNYIVKVGTNAICSSPVYDNMEEEDTSINMITCYPASEPSDHKQLLETLFQANSGLSPGMVEL